MDANHFRCLRAVEQAEKRIKALDIELNETIAQKAKAKTDRDLLVYSKLVERIENELKQETDYRDDHIRRIGIGERMESERNTNPYSDRSLKLNMHNEKIREEAQEKVEKMSDEVKFV